MKVAIAGLTLSLALGTTGAIAATTSSTRTNVCHKSFCGNIKVTKVTVPQMVFTTLTITSWPRFKAVNPNRAFIQLRCAGGQQVKGSTISCAGREVSVQRCWRHDIGRSNCHSWVTFR